VANWTKFLDDSRLNDTAYDAQLNSSSRKLNTHSHYRTFGPDFITLTGFVPRTDIRDAHHFLSYSFRPEGETLISWGPEFLVQRIWDHDGTRTDEFVEASLEWEFTGQTGFEVNYRTGHELLRPEDFSVLSGNKDFPIDSWEIEFETSFIEEFRVEVEFGWGRGINFVPPSLQEPMSADFIDSEVELNLRPITPLTIDNKYILTRLSDRATGVRVFKNEIVRSKWNWQLNRELSLRVILEYQTISPNPQLTRLDRTKNFNFDFLLTYLVNPWTALYVGTNSNHQNLDLIEEEETTKIVRTRGRLLNDSRQF